MNLRNFDLVKAMQIGTKSISALHLIGRNASNAEPAKLLAIFIADTGDNALTTPDQAGGSR